MSISTTSKQWRQTVVTLLVNLHSFHLGVIFSWLTTNVLEFMILRKDFLDEDGGMSRDLYEENCHLLEFSKRLSVLCILAVLPLAAFIAERFGRKKTLALSAIPFALCFTLMTISNKFLWILAATACGGVACALQFYVVPMYVCEISSDNRRGAHGVIRPLLTAGGAYLGYMVEDVWGESINMTISLILLTVFLIVLVKLPESPVWLARKKRIAEANRVLAWLGIEESSPVSENIKLNEELGNIEPTNAEPIAFMNMFKFPEVRKGFAVSVGLLVGQAIIQMISICAFYIASSGLALRIYTVDYDDRILELTWSLVIHVAILIAVCITTSLLIDRIGRIPLLSVSCIGTTIALLIMCTGTGGRCGLFCIVNVTTATIYIICYSLGIGSVPSVIAVEIIPNSVVAYVYAISMGIYWIAVWIVTEILTSYLYYFGLYNRYILFGQAIISALLFIFVVAFVPETKKRKILSPVSVSSH